MKKTDEKVTHEIVQHMETLSESPNGWTKEVNLVSWNGGEAKYDIRSWAPGHEKCGKGLTLTGDEMQMLKAWLEEVEV